jgi:hypothetical protein
VTGVQTCALPILTTFKLSLGQQEREARSQLVLPYLRYVTFFTNLDNCDPINPQTLEPTGSAQKNAKAVHWAWAESFSSPFILSPYILLVFQVNTFQNIF